MAEGSQNSFKDEWLVGFVFCAIGAFILWRMGSHNRLQRGLQRWKPCLTGISILWAFIVAASFGVRFCH